MQLRLIATTGAVVMAAAACAGSAPASTPDAGAELGVESFLSSDPADAERRLLELELRFQESVATCMRAEGFEYLPVDDTAEVELLEEMSERREGENAVLLARGLPSLAFAEREGYGMIQSIELLASAPRVDAVDVNEEYVDSLAPSEAEAYSNALGACEEAAGDDVGFEGVYELMDVASEVSFEAESRLVADPTYIDLLERWAECVASSGLEIGAPVETPFDLLIATERMVMGGLPDVPDTERFDELRGLEIERATVAATCADDLDLSSRVETMVAAFYDEELARRGY